MADQLEAVVLNANQRRHFEVLFARLEDSLNGIEALLWSEPAHSTLSVLENDVTDKARDQAMSIIGGLRDQIVRIASSLDLRPRALSRRRIIGSTLSAEAIRIEDSLSKQLRGYGEVHASVVQHLDPVLEEMSRMLNALAASLRRNTGSPARQ